MTPTELVAARKRLGMSQARFAERLPAPRRTVEDWEADRSKPPRYLYRAVRDLEREVAERIGSQNGTRAEG